MIDIEISLPPELRDVLNNRGYFSADDIVRDLSVKVLHIVRPDLIGIEDMMHLTAADQEVVATVVSKTKRADIFSGLGTHIEHFGGLDLALDFVALQISMSMTTPDDEMLSLLEQEEVDYDTPEFKLKLLQDQFNSTFQMCGTNIQTMEMFCDDPVVAEEYRQKNRDLIAEIKSIGTVENLLEKCGGPDQALGFLMSRISMCLPPFDPQPRIYEAINEGDIETLRESLKHEDVNQRHGKFDTTPLYAAITSVEASFDIMNLLLDHGADPNLGLTETNVVHGFGFGYFQEDQTDAVAQVVQRCVNLGADLEQCSDRLQWTPLMTAIYEMNMAAMVALLRAGADPNARAGDSTGAVSDGKNCLEMAFSPEFVKVLLEFGADPAAKNATGRSAIDYMTSQMVQATSQDYRDTCSKSLDLMLRSQRRH